MILYRTGSTSNEHIQLLAKSVLSEARHYLWNNGLKFCNRRLGERICNEAVMIELVKIVNEKGIKRRKKKNPKVKKGCWKWNILADILSPNKTEQSFFCDENAPESFDEVFEYSKN